MVFDTEMYSNTGGQASKASNIGEVCQFAAAGKEISKKSLSEIAMTYGYIYVAQIALGANPLRLSRPLAEAGGLSRPVLPDHRLRSLRELHGGVKGDQLPERDEEGS